MYRKPNPFYPYLGRDVDDVEGYEAMCTNMPQDIPRSTQVVCFTLLWVGCRIAAAIERLPFYWHEEKESRKLGK